MSQLVHWPHNVVALCDSSNERYGVARAPGSAAQYLFFEKGRKYVLNASLTLMSILVVVITFLFVEYKGFRKDPPIAEPIHKAIIGATAVSFFSGVLALASLIQLRLGRGNTTLRLCVYRDIAKANLENCRTIDAMRTPLDYPSTFINNLKFRESDIAMWIRRWDPDLRGMLEDQNVEIENGCGLFARLVLGHEKNQNCDQILGELRRNKFEVPETCSCG